MDIIGTAKELVQSLEVSYRKNEGNYHPSYRYYTTISTLAIMMINNRFKFGNVLSRRLNDLFEPQEFGPSNKWKHMYNACFAVDRSDSNPMWGLYGVPSSEAICMTIPSRWMKRLRESVEIGYSIERDVKKRYNWLRRNDAKISDDFFKYCKCPPDVSHHDVAYFKSLPQRRDDEEKCNPLMKLYRVREDEPMAELDLSRNGSRVLDSLVGYIKRYQWMYENESRLRVMTAIKHQVKSIYVDLPTGFFRNVTITLGPNFDLGRKKLQSISHASARQVLTAFLDLRTTGCEVSKALKMSSYTGRLNYPGNAGKKKRASAASNSKQTFLYKGHNVLIESWSAKPLYDQYLELKGN